MIYNVKQYYDDINESLTNNCYEELKNKSILVVGANGLIGSSIIDVLNYLNVKKDYNISIIGTVRNKNNILDRFNTYSNLKIIEYDVNNKLELDDNINYIINAASNSHPQKFSSNPVETIVTNFIGTKNLLDYTKNNCCDRFLYVSSGEIYGQGGEDIEAFKEDYSGYIDSTNSRSCYPIGKLSAENLCVCYHNQYGIDTVICRPCHTYGPTQTDSDSRVSAQFINNVLNDKDIIMKSEGSQIRSYCYVLDCVTGLLRVLVSGKSAEAYNISNNNSVLSIREMAEIIATTYGKKVIFELPEEDEKKGYNPVTRSVLDGSKLEKLGWKPCFDFKKGITHTLKIMKQK